MNHMITRQKLEIYKKFEGDVDMFRLTGKKDEQSIFEENDWHLIEDFVRRFHLINSGSASDNFRKETLNLVESQVQRDAVDLLMSLK